MNTYITQANILKNLMHTIVINVLKSISGIPITINYYFYGNVE